MATLKNYNIGRSWRKRYANDTYDMIYMGVKVGQTYDVVNFTINEVKGFYWKTSIAFPCRTPKYKIEKFLKEFVENHITQEEIDGYNGFLKEVTEWGD